MAKKKAPDGNGTIRKRTDGRWEGRYTVGIDPHTGRQIQRSVYAQTQRAAAEALRQKLSSLSDGTYTPPSHLTVGAWMDDWCTDYIGNTTVHTQKSYRGIINNHIKPAIGQLKLSQLDSVKVQKFINALQSTKPGGGPLSPKSVKNIHGVLHSALEQARRLGYIGKNPAALTVLPHRRKGEIMPLNEQLIPQFFNKIKNHQYERLYIVDLLTGLRQSELLGLTWDDVDFSSGTLTIRRQLQYLGCAHGGYVFRHATKNGKTRRIVPAQLVMDCLRQQREWQEDMSNTLGSSWHNEYNLVFTGPMGNHLKHDHVYRCLKRIFAEMGIPDARFHDLRHSYAVLSIQAGDDIKTVQDNLGHYSAAFTLDVYGHVTDSMKRASAKRMENFISGLGGAKNEP